VYWIPTFHGYEYIIHDTEKLIDPKRAKWVLNFLFLTEVIDLIFLSYNCQWVDYNVKENDIQDHI